MIIFFLLYIFKPDAELFVSLSIVYMSLFGLRSSDQCSALPFRQVARTKSRRKKTLPESVHELGSKQKKRKKQENSVNQWLTQILVILNNLMFYIKYLNRKIDDTLDFFHCLLLTTAEAQTFDLFSKQNSENCYTNSMKQSKKKKKNRQRERGND